MTQRLFETIRCMNFYSLYYELTFWLSIPFLFLCHSLFLSHSHSSPAGIFLISCGNIESRTFILYYASGMYECTLYMYLYPVYYELVPCLSIPFLFLYLTLSLFHSRLLQEYVTISRVTSSLSIMLLGKYIGIQSLTI